MLDIAAALSLYRAAFRRCRARRAAKSAIQLRHGKSKDRKMEFYFSVPFLSLSRMPFYELYELMICVDNIEMASFYAHLLLLHDIEG